MGHMDPYGPGGGVGWGGKKIGPWARAHGPWARAHGPIWAHGPYGSIWAHMGPYGLWMLVPSVVLVPSFVLKPSPEIDFLSVFLQIRC